jgi:hypothetical protein
VECYLSPFLQKNDIGDNVRKPPKEIMESHKLFFFLLKWIFKNRIIIQHSKCQTWKYSMIVQWMVITNKFNYLGLTSEVVR